MRPLSDRITQLPLSPGTSGFPALLAGAAAASPYLDKLISRDPAWVEEIGATAPESALSDLLDHTRTGIEGAASMAEIGRRLRWAKARMALLVALADLGGVWDLSAVTGALSRFADWAVARTADWLLARDLAAGKLPGLSMTDLASGAGYCVLAMGKHGARELNYSSDIDLICLFDQSRFAPEDFAQAKARYVRVTRDLVKLLSETTEHGYVLRTDLRLRPAPSTTPVCMAMEAAERYYESVGRTWERAAHIKARPVAGDLTAGRAYLDRLTPFVWRRHLDFAAVEETHGMLRKIRETKGRFARDELGGTDIKLSPGGIREIEFFAQCLQLTRGGRQPELRDSTTLGALAALARARVIPEATAAGLSEAYTAHRTLEHRLQMIGDAQTHTIPASAEGRARVAALMGRGDLADWEQEISDRMARVHATAETFFVPDPAPEAAPLSGTVPAERLTELGFQRIEDTGRILARWHGGEIAATRDARARAMYRGLAPRILDVLAQAGDPDEAVVRLDRFLSGLPAGVQVFALFTSNPHLLDLIVRLCAMAPRLAGYLGRNPQVLDALLDQDFFEPLPDAGALAADLAADLDRERDYERMLDAVRRWAREVRFRAGVQLLSDTADAEETGRALSAIAEAAIRVLLPRVAADFATRHGPPPGRGLAVIAMGKLGSGEMTAQSDLDLIMVYDPGGVEMSEGRRPLPVSAYYPRLTQALLAALTAPTAEGRLYEVDMRLRPSGRQGPVAVSLESFAKYQTEAAWVWEHLALTRARVVAGAADLVADIEQEIARTLMRRKGRAEVMDEAREMRARLAEAQGDSGPLALKSGPGGLMEIEFLAQTGVLEAGLTGARAASAALPALAAAGWLAERDAARLADTHALLHRLQQIERLALDAPLEAAPLGAALQDRLAGAAGLADGETLETRLSSVRVVAAEIIARRFGDRSSSAPG
ncbi:MAG: bifunctional [glutamine synthetase] adenylyltransferase/[glutamine synthetase]-adenylyl-L-tyrosine phosphorylase [Pseudomonadota bacterium]